LSSFSIPAYPLQILVEGGVCKVYHGFPKTFNHAVFTALDFSRAVAEIPQNKVRTPYLCENAVAPT
jgi:hypothetical protein